MAALARWCFRHRVLVLVGWTGLLVVLIGAGTTAGTRYPATFDLPGTDSAAAQALLAGAGAGSSTGTVVLHALSGTLETPDRTARIERTVDAIAARPGVVAALGPDASDGVGRISADGRTALVEVAFQDEAENLAPGLVDATRSTALSLAGPGVEVAFGGDAFADPDVTPSSVGELVGLAAAAVVLFLVFGSLLSTSIPLLSGVFGLTAAAEVIGLLSHVMDIAAVAPRAATLVGLGVGIDYALFVLTRYREALLEGRPPEDAAAHAVTTSGRAVVFAGGSVVLAMAGLWVPGVPFLRGIGVAAMVAVAFAVAASLTVLPAAFGVFGARLLPRALRTTHLRSGPSTARHPHWTRLSARVERRPVLSGVAALLVMVVLALPLATVRLGSADDGTAAPGSSARHAYDLTAAAFGPGANGRLVVVAEVPTASDRSTVVALAGLLATVPGVAAVGTVTRSANCRRCVTTRSVPTSSRSTSNPPAHRRPPPPETSSTPSGPRSRTAPPAWTSTSAAPRRCCTTSRPC